MQEGTWVLALTVRYVACEDRSPKRWQTLHGVNQSSTGRTTSQEASGEGEEQVGKRPRVVFGGKSAAGPAGRLAGRPVRVSWVRPAGKLKGAARAIQWCRWYQVLTNITSRYV